MAEKNVPTIVEVSLLADRRGVEIMASSPPPVGVSFESKRIAECLSRASAALLGTTVEKVTHGPTVSRPVGNGYVAFMTRWRILYDAPQEVEALTKAQASVVAALRAGGLPAKGAAA